MLVGLYSPSYGTASINGFDIQIDPKEAFNSLGICPQQNILFNDLTVEEHLKFFCMLKGMFDEDTIKKEIARYSTLMNFQYMLNMKSQELSGGMKRKLSVAIALCGNSKILILDEPTSGLDPGARRELWNILLNEKRNRTILLTTHSMEEAEVLGDRIAILNEGILRTVGSSFFLKQKFGTGYRVTIVKGKNFNSQKILDLIKTFTPSSYLESENKTKAVFVIDERQVKFFEALFKALEENFKTLEIENFSCSLSSLEDVFIKLGNENKKSEENDQIPQEIRRKSRKVQGLKVSIYQINAILIKKFWVFVKSWKMLFCMTFFSILILLIFSAKLEVVTDERKLKFTLESYDEAYTILEGKGSKFALKYEKLLSTKSHLIKTEEKVLRIAQKISKENFGKFYKKYLIGGSFNSNSATAWFNGQSYHTMPLSLNEVYRAIVKSIKNDSYDISVYNQPLMPHLGSDSFGEIFEDLVSSLNTALLLFALFILLTHWPFVFTTHYVTERETQGKLLQFISGMNPFIYWIISFLFDLIIFFIICCFLMAFAMYTGKLLIMSWGGYVLLLIISFSYGFSMLPFSYLCSFMFRKKSNFIVTFSVVVLVGKFIKIKLWDKIKNLKFKI